MKTNTCILFCLLLIFLTSCYYDKEVLIYGTSACDTTNVKYSMQIIGTLSANCLSCHGGNAASGAGIQLGSYDAVKVHALNGKLIGAVSHSQGLSPMPKGASKLPDCRIAEIRTWIRNGAPNN